MSKKAIIIGSGIAGLALSVRLKVKGYDVHVFEKNESYGGKLSEFKLGEYRYDFGPKLFTLPELLIDLFKISNQIYASSEIVAGINLSNKTKNSPWKIDPETWKSYLFQ